METKRKESAMQRLRRKKLFEDYQKNERTICLCIEEIIREHGQPFDVVFPRVIKTFENIGKLSSQADRTTNPKRLRRAWEALERKRTDQHNRLVRALAGTLEPGHFNSPSNAT
jgi:hypothetical protein